MQPFEQLQLFSPEQPYSNMGKKVAEAFLSLCTEPNAAGRGGGSRGWKGVGALHTYAKFKKNRTNPKAHVLAEVNDSLPILQTSCLSHCTFGGTVSDCLLPENSMMKPEQQLYEAWIHSLQCCCRDPPHYPVLCLDVIPSQPEIILVLWKEDFFALYIIRNCPCGISHLQLDQRPYSHNGRETYLRNYDPSPARLSDLFDKLRVTE